MEDIYALAIGAVSIALGAGCFYAYTVWADPFYKARILTRFKNKEYLALFVKTSPTTISGVKVIPIDKKEVKILGQGYDVEPNLSIRMLGVQCLFYTHKNTKPVSFNEYDADLHHVLFPVSIFVNGQGFVEKKDLAVEKLRVPDGTDKDGKPRYRDVEGFRYAVKREFSAKELMPDGTVFKESPYPGLLEIPEMAKEIRYRPVESPKMKSALMDANESEAEARATIERQKKLDDLTMLCYAAIIVGILAVGVGALGMMKTGSVDAKIDLLSSNMTAIKGSLDVLNTTISNNTMTVLR